MSPRLFDTDTPPGISLSLQEIALKAQEMVGKMSISGAQPKLSMKLDRRRGELVTAATGGRYILKPQVQRFPHVPENESCCMAIAQELGIDTPPHGLLPLLDGTLAYVVKRFDRRGRTKLHQEHFFQILGKKDKYAGSVEEMGKRLREISAVPGLDVQLLFERVVFNFLIGNGDGHLQNYSVRYREDGGIRLAPAYDLVCTKLVIPREEDSALTINGKHDNLRRGDFDALAEAWRIPEKVRYEHFGGQLNRVVGLIAESRLPKAFRERFVEIVRSRFERMGLPT